MIPEQNTVIQNKSENKRGLLNSELMSQPQHRTLEVIHKKKVKKVKTENKQNTFEWKIDLPTKNELESIEIKARLKQDNQKIKEQIEIIDKVVSEFEEKIQNKDALTSEKIQEIITGQVENQENIENKVSVTQENKISNFDLETGNQESKKPKSQNQIEPETIDLTKTILSTPITEVKMADKPNSSENPTISLYDLFS